MQLETHVFKIVGCFAGSVSRIRETKNPTWRKPFITHLKVNNFLLSNFHITETVLNFITLCSWSSKIIPSLRNKEMFRNSSLAINKLLVFRKVLHSILRKETGQCRWGFSVVILNPLWQLLRWCLTMGALLLQHHTQFILFFLWTLNSRWC
jgi:hypothetical protein